jgi:hypothetical protein
LTTSRRLRKVILAADLIPSGVPQVRGLPPVGRWCPVNFLPGESVYVAGTSI